MKETNQNNASNIKKQINYSPVVENAERKSTLKINNNNNLNQNNQNLQKIKNKISNINTISSSSNNFSNFSSNDNNNSNFGNYNHCQTLTNPREEKLFEYISDKSQE